MRLKATSSLLHLLLAEDMVTTMGKTMGLMWGSHFSHRKLYHASSLTLLSTGKYLWSANERKCTLDMTSKFYLVFKIFVKSKYNTRSPISQYKWLSQKKKKKHITVGLWSFKDGQLRIILLNILFCKNKVNKTLLSTYNVLPLYWTWSMLLSSFVITWTVLSSFYRGGNWGS